MGRLYGVGVGPGDPELVTIKALRVLEEVPVIAVPASKRPGECGGAVRGRAIDIVRSVLDTSGKELLPLYMPMTKDPSVLEESRREAAALLAGRLSGGDVAFVTLGDPMLYSTFGYLVPLVGSLAPGAEVKVVPGVSSISAASSASLCPLAETDERVLIVPAAYDTAEIERWVAEFDTVVLMKVTGEIDGLIEALERRGLASTSVFATEIGWEGERVVTGLDGIRGERPGYFSMIIIRGRAVARPAS